MLEADVQEFWKVSRAWKRDPEYLEGHTFSTIVSALEPMRLQGQHHSLRLQADSLAALAVSGKIRRKKGTIKGKVIRVNFRSTQTSPLLKCAS